MGDMSYYISVEVYFGTGRKVTVLWLCKGLTRPAMF